MEVNVPPKPAEGLLRPSDTTRQHLANGGGGREAMMKDNEEDNKEVLAVPSSEARLRKAAGAGEWSSWGDGMCMCHEDCGACMVVACCYPAALAQAKTSFDATSFTLNCFVSACAPCFAAVVFRNEVRVAYGIHGYWWQDLAEGCFCACCSACQLSREVSRRGSVKVPQLVALV
ncbi:Protein PLANT CADMIUM RESISTANCE 1 [Diplonema papillatum]|nr:Protein PLANT CADMIUM RESISTANCE 1 [Diplonema papillatum]